MEWSGVEGRGGEGSGVEWSGGEWSGVEGSGVEWRGGEGRGVEWSGDAPWTLFSFLFFSLLFTLLGAMFASSRFKLRTNRMETRDTRDLLAQARGARMALEREGGVKGGECPGGPTRASASR